MKFYSEHNEDKWIAKNLRLPKKGFYLDQFSFRYTLPGTRTGYVFT